MRTNRVLQAYKEGRPSFGIYVMIPSPALVELLGFSGLDFIRIDLHDSSIDIQTLREMILIAHASGITPFVRIPGWDAKGEWYCRTVLNMGAMGIIVPRVTGPEVVEAAVRATKAPPKGNATFAPSGFLNGYGQVGSQEFNDWARENIILSVQVETKRGVEAIDEIVSVAGLDMVQSGRGDLSREYGVPGQQYHPVVLEAQDTVIQAGIKAGKMVSVQYYPLREPAQIDTIRDWVQKGVHCLSLGVDKDIINIFRRTLEALKA